MNEQDIEQVKAVIKKIETGELIDTNQITASLEELIAPDQKRWDPVSFNRQDLIDLTEEHYGPDLDYEPEMTEERKAHLTKNMDTATAIVRNFTDEDIHGIADALTDGTDFEHWRWDRLRYFLIEHIDAKAPGLSPYPADEPDDDDDSEW